MSRCHWMEPKKPCGGNRRINCQKQGGGPGLSTLLSIMLISWLSIVTTYCLTILDNLNIHYGWLNIVFLADLRDAISHWCCPWPDNWSIQHLVFWQLRWQTVDSGQWTGCVTHHPSARVGHSRGSCCHLGLLKTTRRWTRITMRWTRLQQDGLVFNLRDKCPGQGLQHERIVLQCDRWEIIAWIIAWRTSNTTRMTRTALWTTERRTSWAGAGCFIFWILTCWSMLV